MSLNVALTRFNQEFVQLLEAVKETNAAKLYFNDVQHEHNVEILDNGLDAVGLTEGAGEFGNLIAQLTEQVSANTELLEEGFEASNQNGQKFAEIRESLEAELAAIDECWDKIEAQQALAAELVASL
jgi:hypothetical protein